MHHLIEKWIIKYMMNNKLIKKPNTKSIKNIAKAIWSWMGNKEH